MEKSIKGVIFDLDGVITDTEEYHYLAWKEIAEEVGISIDRAFNENLKGISRTESLELILKFGNCENKFSNEEKEALATKKNKNYLELIKKTTSEDILPGIKDFLIELKENKLKIAMASASKNAFLVSKYLDIYDLFDHIVDANTVINSKPHPEIFLKAAEYINIDPLYCVGIEDSVAGVASINSANMYSIGIGNKNVLKEADLVLESTSLLNFKVISDIYK